MRISICGHTFQIRETACTQDPKLPKLLSGTVHIMCISRAHLSTLMSLYNVVDSTVNDILKRHKALRRFQVTRLKHSLLTPSFRRFEKRHGNVTSSHQWRFSDTLFLSTYGRFLVVCVLAIKSGCTIILCFHIFINLKIIFNSWKREHTRLRKT